MDKSALRRQYRHLRLSLSADERAHASARICEQIPLLIPPDARCVGAYAAIKGEADLAPALMALHGRGVVVALPAVVTKHQPLMFRPWLPATPLRGDEYGIPAPESSLETVIPDIVLVPLLAFDRAGHRLGYGGGYYDRTLEQLQALGLKKAIGVAFAAQEHPSLPAEPHDITLDAVVTEREVIEFTPKG